MAYAFPRSQFAIDTHLLKLLRLMNRPLRANGNFISLGCYLKDAIGYYDYIASVVD
jgi:hypothetical protein